MLKLVDIISERLSIKKEKIIMDSHLESDLGIDSLDQIELFMEIEDNFEIDINTEIFIDCKTIRNIVVLLESLNVDKKLIDVSII